VPNDTEWVQQIIKAINTLLPKDFVGKLEVNCVSGHVGNLSVTRSYREDNPLKKEAGSPRTS
jgi:RNA binding exosome subunit